MAHELFITLSVIFSYGMLNSQLWLVGSNSLTWDQTWAPELGSQSLSLWSTREVPTYLFLKAHTSGFKPSVTAYWLQKLEQVIFTSLSLSFVIC